MIRARKKSGGFTLVELMIVVAIIGILAAVAIPAFSRYVKKSRTTEAVGHLNKEWAGSLTYYETDHMSTGGIPLPKQFPGNTAAVMPNGGGTFGTGEAHDCGCATGGKCPGWHRLGLVGAQLLAPGSLQLSAVLRIVRHRSDLCLHGGGARRPELQYCSVDVRTYGQR